MFLLELVLEMFGQAVVEAIFEFFWWGGSKTLRSRFGRLAVSAAVGFGAGLWWGDRLQGQPGYPRTVGASLLLALAGAFLVTQTPQRAASGLLPWRWSAHQWEGFAVLNAFVGAGCALGYS